MAKEIDSKSIEFIRDDFKKLFNKSLNAFLLFTSWGSKLLCLTMFLLVVDANAYLFQYYQDDEFDNR